MLTEYQKLEQLKILRRLFDYDEIKKQALDMAIKIVVTEFNSRKPCVFDEKVRCRILTKKECHNCSFRRSKEEYEEDQRKAVELLEAKGLKVVKVKVDGKEIFHVLSLTDEAPKSYN